MADMERIEVELFSHRGNNAVVKTPGRRFPSVLIQGDSLLNLRHEVARVVEACTRGNVDEARRERAVLADLDALLEDYSTALRNQNIPLPFLQPDI